MEPTVSTDNAAFDLEDLLARCLGNMEFVERVLDKFQSHFRSDLKQLEAALDSEDVDTVGRLAHRIKGASANVSARRLQAQAAGIEDLARGGRLEHISRRLEELRGEWDLFADVVALIPPPNSRAL